MAKNTTGNPRMVDSPGPKDPIMQDNSDAKAKGMAVNSFKSSESQKGAPFSGIKDTGSGDIKQLKRSTPSVGVYQAEGQNRGGQATSNYDTKVDADKVFENPSLKALRQKQDGKSTGGPNDND